MFYTGLFKRTIPFVLTFAAGLLLASFFGSITPNFSGWRSERRDGRRHERRQLSIENEELRQKLRETEEELRELRRSLPDQEVEFVSPPVDFDEHHPPAPPKKPKHPRFERIR
jgi:hypothetical protein